MKGKDREEDPFIQGIWTAAHLWGKLWECSVSHWLKMKPRLFCLWTTLYKSCTNLGTKQPVSDSKNVQCILLFVLCFVLCSWNSIPVKAARYDRVQHNESCIKKEQRNYKVIVQLSHPVPHCHLTSKLTAEPAHYCSVDEKYWHLHCSATLVLNLTWTNSKLHTELKV